MSRPTYQQLETENKQLWAAISVTCASLDRIRSDWEKTKEMAIREFPWLKDNLKQSTVSIC